MKTIESAALKYAEPIATYTYFKGMDDLTYCDLEDCIAESFKEGVEFAQRQIPVEEELPDEKNGYINKEVIAFTSDNCAYVLIYNDYIGWLPNGTDADIDNITHWRLIELI